MRFPGRNKVTAVAVHDGLVWRAYAFRREHGAWTCTGRAEEPSRSGRQLPQAILDFMAHSHAKRLRVLVSGDVHALTAEMPEDASDEELHTALAYEAQGELGLEAADHRLAVARAGLYDMGGERNALLAVGFERERLQKFATEAEGEGIRFEGVGSLELAVLAAHAQRNPQRRLLLIRARTSFYAVPSHDSQPFMTAMLPLGLDMSSDPTAHERAERARERLSRHDASPLTVVVASDIEIQREKITPYLGACTDVTFIALAELEETALQNAVGGRPGGIDDACPWIGLPPPPRDPHRHGTVILFVTLAVTLGWVGMSKQRLNQDLHMSQTNLAAWETLEHARKKATNESKALRERQNTLLAKHALLERRHCLPHGLLPLLSTLADNMPAYSCLLSITPHEGSGFDITGLTQWQDGLPQLDAALRKMSQREGLRREFGGLETSEGQNAQRFRFTVLPGEERP